MPKKIDRNILHICAPHMPLFPWGIQKKSHSFSYSYITLDYFRYLRRKHNETVVLQLSSLRTVVQCFQSSYYLHSLTILPHLGHATGGARVSSTRYGRVATAACCDMGWNSAERGVWCDWSVLERLEAVSIPKVVISNICCDVACLTFQLPHITAGFFWATNIWRIITNLNSVKWKSFAFHKLVW